MNNPSQEDLLGYVLGALDAQEQRNVQQSIDDNPEIEEQLLRIKNSLLPLDCLENSGPTPGLARRTCESVAGWQHEPSCDWADDQLVSSHRRSLDSSLRSAMDVEAPAIAKPRLKPSVSDRMLHPQTWSIPDVLVGMALIAILAGILFPAISYSRYHSRIVHCQSNLSQVGFALMNYSSANDGKCTFIPKDDRFAVVGWVGPTLKDTGFIEDESIFACAGIAAERPPVHIPSRRQIMNADCEEVFDRLCHTAVGHYGFAMGYHANGRYHPPQVGRANVVLFADQPSCLPNRESGNHGGKGQNLCFGDGHVAFVVGPAFGNDAVFQNDFGYVGTGTNAMDNVIAPSHLPFRRADRIFQTIESESY